jgi:hypothetical protein
LELAGKIYHLATQQNPAKKLNPKNIPVQTGGTLRLQSNGDNSKEIVPIRPIAILPGTMAMETDKLYRLM